VQEAVVQQKLPLIVFQQSIANKSFNSFGSSRLNIFEPADYIGPGSEIRFWYCWTWAFKVLVRTPKNHFSKGYINKNIEEKSIITQNTGDTESTFQLPKDPVANHPVLFSKRTYEYFESIWPVSKINLKFKNTRSGLIVS
jgi:hypothetical protein